MKLYFKTSTEARNYKKGHSNMKVIDIRNKPFNGPHGWAVRIDTNH